MNLSRRTLMNALGRRFPRGSRLRRLAVAGAVLGTSVLGSMAIIATGPEVVPESKPEKAWPVSIAQVRPEAVRPTVLAYGRVESGAVAELQTDLVADVVALNVEEGDWVEAGDVLVQLDDARFRLDLAEAQADLTEARATLRSLETERSLLEESAPDHESVFRAAQEDLERHESLFERRLISSRTLDEARTAADRARIAWREFRERIAKIPDRIAVERARVQRAEARLGRARLDLDRTRIVAPFAGPVLSVDAAPGERTNLSRTLVSVADASRYEVRLALPEAQAERLRGTADPSAVRGVTADGTRLSLERLGRRVRQGRSGTDAFFRFDAMDGRALPPLGELLDVTVVLPEERDVIALPVQSLFDGDRIYRVADVEGEPRLQAVDVTRVGERREAGGAYQVLVRAPGLDAGARVITTPLPSAIPGLLVAPIEAAATADAEGVPGADAAVEADGVKGGGPVS